MDLEKIRDEFPILKKQVYLNAASLAPSSKSVVSFMHEYLDDWLERGSAGWIENPHPRVKEAKSLFAGLIGAGDEEVAFTPSTTLGLNMASGSIGYQSGSNVVVYERDFPSNLYILLKLRSRGVEIRKVPYTGPRVELSDVEKRVDDRTAVMLASHVQWENGFRSDVRGLSEIVHRRGGLLMVDVMQSAGATTIDVKRDGIDLLACGCSKWLLGPIGSGFMYARKDLIPQLESPIPGWSSIDEKARRGSEWIFPEEPRYYDDARKFEPAPLSPIAFVGACAGLRMIREAGVEEIERRTASLTERLIDGLQGLDLEIQSPHDPEHRSAITNFRISQPVSVVEKLRSRGIIVGSRMGGIRVSPHFYNAPEDIDRLLEEVRGLK